MSFSYTENIPHAPNNPSNDQPKMEVNNNSNFLIWDVDHIGFNANYGGTHQFVTMINTPNFISPAAPSGQSSVIYAGAGIASPSTAQAYFQNSGATFQLSAVRAWAYCSGVQGASPVIIQNQSYNVVSVVKNGAAGTGFYTVTLKDNAVSSQYFAVLATTSGTTTGNATFIQFTNEVYASPTGKFDLYTYFAFNQGQSGYPDADAIGFSFIVLQI